MKFITPSRPLLFVEFILLMGLCTSLVALAIDAMLPALPLIGEDLQVADTNNTQLVVSILIFGIGLGQLIFWPLSDAIGRKKSFAAGMLVFVLGCLISIFSSSFEAMIFGRLLQGIGIAGPRVVPVALIRDQYEGRNMARIMSLVMMVFIFTPIIAPALGQLVLYIADWRAIFILFLLLGMFILSWFLIRQPETRSPERRIPYSFNRIVNHVKEICHIRLAIGYTIAIGIISGSFIAYLSMAQAIFQKQYALGEDFPFYFAGLAIAIGTASYINSRLVMRFGMSRLTHWALRAIIILSCIFALPAYISGGHPPLAILLTYLALTLFFVGILFGNMNSLAMQPLGHIAGIGAAIVGALSTFISVGIGILIGRFYDQSVMPLVVGFLLFAALTLVTVFWAEQETR